MLVLFFSYQITKNPKVLNQDHPQLKLEKVLNPAKPENKTPSWFDKLKAPRPSDLARKRRNHANPPPVGKKRFHATSTGKRNYDPKKVSASERVREFPGKHLTVSGGKLFCITCRESVVLKKERTSQSCEKCKA